MLRTPLVAVVVPTYNRVHLLQATLRSVLEQSLTDFELLVLDDGSTDDTRAVVGAIGDPRIRYERVAHTARLSRLRNLGVRLARADLVAFLDHDDLWAPEKLERQLALLDAHPECGLCATDSQSFDEAGLHDDGDHLTTLLADEATGGVFVGSLFRRLIEARLGLLPSSIVVRRAAFDAVGGLDERLRTGDSEFLVRLSHRTRAAVVLETLVYRRRHPGSMSRVWTVEGYDEILMALDYFHDFGEVDNEIYASLRARYCRRREAALASLDEAPT